MKNKSVFFSYVKNNKKSFFCLLVLFFCGLIGGIVFINNASETQMNEISSYVNSLKDNIKSSDHINKTVILMQSMKQNALFVAIIWFLGCTILRQFFDLFGDNV